MYNSQAGQDKFVNICHNNKQNGTFVEIGTGHFALHNNSYFFEKHLQWKGLLVDFDKTAEDSYIHCRSNSSYIIDDATKIDYLAELNKLNFPTTIDYLQIDLEVTNNSTMQVLDLFDAHVFDTYKFATVTFETDRYRGDFFNTTERSREIFKRHGYKLVYPDVNITEGENNLLGPFEDWYVHPDLIDISTLPNVIDYESSVNGLWKSRALLHTEEE